MLTKTMATGGPLAALLLSACVEGTAPVQPEPIADSAIEPATGIAKSSLLIVQSLGSSIGPGTYAIVYFPDKIDRAQLRAAPARLCAARGKTLVSARDRASEPRHSLPGTRLTLVTCK